MNEKQFIIDRLRHTIQKHEHNYSFSIYTKPDLEQIIKEVEMLRLR